LKKYARSIQDKEDVMKIASISAQDEEIGKIIADTMDEV
jgi:hypothetical protein